MLMAKVKFPESKRFTAMWQFTPKPKKKTSAQQYNLLKPYVSHKNDVIDQGKYRKRSIKHMFTDPEYHVQNN